MSGFWHAPDDYAWGENSRQGSAHSVDGREPDYDVVKALREVVEEVTGKPAVPVRRIGFY